MAVDNQKLAQSRPGSTAETNPTDQWLPSGVYRHPESGEELITLHDPLYGDAQSAAAKRVGFEYVGEAPEGAVKSILTASEDFGNKPERALEASANDLNDLRARLNALEAENSRLKAPEAPADSLNAERVKAEAARSVETQTGTAVDPSTGDVAESEVKSTKKGSK